MQEALVTSVSDELFKYIPDDNGQIISMPHGPYEVEAWKRKAERIEGQYSKRLAMVIGPVEVVMHVAMLKGLKRTDDGAMVKDYAVIPGTETDFAAQTIVTEVASEDQRFLESAAVDVTEEFPVGSKAFYLGDFNYGRPLQVAGHSGGKTSIYLLTEKSKEPQFGHQIAAQVEQHNPYVPSYQVARMLGLNPLVLSKITSSFSVMVDDERQNLGLNLKFEAKKLKVLGYSRKRGNGWEFSEKAIALLREYMQKFPEFFRALQRNPQGDIYQDTEFYPADIVEQKMAEIKNWLKGIQSRGLEKVSLEAQQLDGDTVKRIEAAVDGWLAKSDEKVPRGINNVPRRALLKPADAEHRCSNQKFVIGDRVVYVQDSGKVPIGSRGTVIGLTQTTRLTLLDVVWDVTFMSGTTLGERCSPFRGMTVPVGSVLNLTNRQVVAMSAAAASKQVAEKAASGPVPVGATVNAPNPPPLRGGYSNVVSGRGGRGGHVNGYQNGQASGSGGHPLPIHPGPPHQGANNQNHKGPAGPVPRGNMARGGFQPQRLPVIMQRPQNQNPVVTPSATPVRDEKPEGRVLPKSYQAVPPPPNLNRGGFRGRGRGAHRGQQGRGGHGRGRGVVPPPLAQG